MALVPDDSGRSAYSVEAAGQGKSYTWMMGIHQRRCIDINFELIHENCLSRMLILNSKSYPWSTAGTLACMFEPEVVRC